MSAVNQHRPGVWEQRANALEALLACYRTGSQPSERLHRELERTKQLVATPTAGDGHDPQAPFSLVKAGANAIRRIALDERNRFLQNNAARLSRAVLEEPPVAEALGHQAVHQEPKPT